MGDCDLGIHGTLEHMSQTDGHRLENEGYLVLGESEKGLTRSISIKERPEISLQCMPCLPGKGENKWGLKVTITEQARNDKFK